MMFVRFFAFGPRAAIPRWLLWFVFTLGLARLWLLAAWDAEGAILVALYALLGLATAKLAAESVRRLHDCGQSGRFGLGVMAGVLALVVTAMLRWIGYGNDAFYWTALAMAVLAAAVLLLRPGTRGPNAYGPAPSLWLPSGSGLGKTGPRIAIGFVLAASALGWLIAQWQAGMERQAEWRARHAERQDVERQGSKSR